MDSHHARSTAARDPDGGDRPRWNHNIHYHRLILDAVPPGARTALDIGTGNGLLAAELSEVVERVTGIDADAEVLRSARHEASNVSFVHGDVLTHPFAPESFDLVGSVATLHHLPDVEGALRRCAELTAPGGALVIVGLSRTSRVREFALHLRGLVQHRYLSHRRGLWEHTAPTVWPPPHTYVEIEAAVRRELPGATFRLLPMWRYAVVWRKPGRRSDPA
ncbi:bifunctional 2-polyprenyl-6-hydroxyphenol methylase/3-demethylubiquinol 3-O-methyltransferase UbiG [Williamsia sp.]|uniref:class I SAM-dependent methyltransferase n=1 Tax=Williamsia sp. TaxID=1872085 RepID=UPI001A1EFF00|nr:class I SAM-dependent methyltransferase [Williamsia sp.]MBJ7287639.1 class I SAM-dependent methyltransferase [Williamsia sp.]